MFDFRKITLADKDWITEKLAVSDRRGCEYCFANNLAWHRLADTVITEHDGFYICCSFEEGIPVFTFPTGVTTEERNRDRFFKLFSELEKFTDYQGKPFVLCSVQNDEVIWLKEYYKNRISIKPSENGFDYIYETEALTKLEGKKFHGKRNHIKRFKDNNWSYEPITPEHFDECIRYAVDIYNNSEKYDGFSAVVEQYALNTFFSNYEYLGLKGGILRVDGKMAGFTIGEPLNSDTFDIHIEKADPSIQGAYPTLFNEFISHEAQGLRYINREEDLGLEGLRKSKLSYHPVFLLEKNYVSFSKEV